VDVRPCQLKARSFICKSYVLQPGASSVICLRANIPLAKRTGKTPPAKDSDK
jgi:hypothetical protein